MKNFESKNITPEDSSGKENKEYKSDSTKFHEQKVEEEREKIEELMKKTKKLRKNWGIYQINSKK